MQIEIWRPYLIKIIKDIGFFKDNFENSLSGTETSFKKQDDFNKLIKHLEALFQRFYCISSGVEIKYQEGKPFLINQNHEIIKSQEVFAKYLKESIKRKGLLYLRREDLLKFDETYKLIEEKLIRFNLTTFQEEQSHLITLYKRERDYNKCILAFLCKDITQLEGILINDEKNGIDKNTFIDELVNELNKLSHHCKIWIITDHIKNLLAYPCNLSEEPSQNLAIRYHNSLIGFWHIEQEINKRSLFTEIISTTEKPVDEFKDKENNENSPEVINKLNEILERVEGIEAQGKLKQETTQKSVGEIKHNYTFEKCIEGKMKGKVRVFYKGREKGDLPGPIRQKVFEYLLNNSNNKNAISLRNIKKACGVKSENALKNTYIGEINTMLRMVHGNEKTYITLDQKNKIFCHNIPL